MRFHVPWVDILPHLKPLVGSGVANYEEWPSAFIYDQRVVKLWYEIRTHFCSAVQGHDFRQRDHSGQADTVKRSYVSEKLIYKNLRQ